MAVDSFSHSSEDVLNDLDPLSRALLDLSLQRGMDDAEIADVLGTDQESVFEVRVGLLRALAEKVAPEHADADPAELQAVITDRLYADPAAQAEEIADLEAAVPAPEPEPEPESELEPEPDWLTDRDQPAEPRRRRSPLVVLLPILLVIAVVGAIVLIAGGSDGDKSADQPAAQAPAPDQPTAKPEPEAATQPKARAVRLAAIGSGDATGTATLTGNRLKLKLRGLPSANGGSYQVWAYNSVIDAKPIGTPKSAKLPADAKDYRYVDVSIEPADGNANHSGRSVLRVPLKQLQQP
jgi:hypothetical protein